MKKSHPPSAMTPSPFHFVQSEESTARASDVSAVILPWKGKNIYPGGTSQSQEVVLIPQVAEIETITNLEGGFWGGQGRLGGRLPCAEGTACPRRLSLPRCWRRKRTFPRRQRKFQFPQSRVFSVSSTLPHPEARPQAFLELLSVTWPSTAMTLLLKHMWPQDFFLLCFSRVQMTAQNIICQKIADIKNMGICVHNNSTNFAGYVTQRDIFSPPFNMVPWRISSKSHT